MNAISTSDPKLHRRLSRRARVPGDMLRALAVLYERTAVGRERGSLARALAARTAAAGHDYHVRTIRRQLTGEVATVPLVVEAVAKELVMEAAALRSELELDRALGSAGLIVPPDRRRAPYLPIHRLVPLVDLWLLLHSDRSKRSLASALAVSLAGDGVRLGIDSLQHTLAGRRPRVRTEVLEHLLRLLGRDGLESEEQALARRELRRAELAAYRRERTLEPCERLLYLVGAWKAARREPSSRRLAVLLGERLRARGVRLSLRHIQQAVDGKARRVRAALIVEAEKLLAEALPAGRSVRAEATPSTGRRLRALDFGWVRCEPIAALAALWLERHPGVSMRQLCLRVVHTVRRMGYRSALNSIQPILAGHRGRTRAFVYRAMLRQLPETSQRIPDAHRIGVKPERPRDEASRRAPAKIGRPRAAARACCGEPEAWSRDVTRPAYPARSSPAEELRLARCVEQADAALLGALLRSSTTARELERIGRELAGGSLGPREIVVGARPSDPEEERLERERLRRALAEVAALEAECLPMRQAVVLGGISAEQRSRLWGELEARWGRMAAALSGVRLGMQHLQAMRDAFGALAERAGCVKPPARTLDAAAVRRAVLEAGLPLEELAESWTRVQAAARAAAQSRNDLVKASQWLVFAIARRYRSRGLDLPDLVAEGNFGLMRAVDKYDAHRGCRFTTYAAWWIRSMVERGLTEMSRNIRLPGALSGQLRRLRRMAQRAYQQRGTCPALGDLAPEVGLRRDAIRGLELVDGGTLSLQAPHGESGARLEDFLSDGATPAPLDAVAQRELSSHLRQALVGLPSREALVLDLRFGLRTRRVHTLAEVAIALGVSREGARQIETRALRHLRTAPAARRLRGFLDEGAGTVELGSLG